MRGPLIVALLAAFAWGGLPLEATGRDLKSLVHDLNGKDLPSRIRAAQALGEMGPRGKRAVGDLIKALHAKELPLRHEAVIALGRIGTGAAQAVPDLQELAQHAP